MTKKESQQLSGLWLLKTNSVVSGFLKREADKIGTTERATKLLKEEVAEIPSRLEVTKPLPPTKKIPIPSAEKEIPMQIQIRLDFQVPLLPKESEIKSIADTIHKIRDLLLRKVKEEEK